MAHGAPTRRKPVDNDEEYEEDENSLPTPPDGGWGWVVVFGSFMVHVITDGITYSFGMFYVEFLKYFNEGKGFTAAIASILVGVTLCSGPISSSFVNKYGCRVVTIVGSILAGVCLILSVFAQNVLTLIITIGIGCGFGLGLIYLPAIVSVTMYFEKYRSLATGIAVCGSGLGTFIFSPLVDKLIEEYNWRGAMLIIAALVFNCILFGALFRPLTPTTKQSAVTDGTVQESTPLRAVSSEPESTRTKAERLMLPTTESEGVLSRSFSVGYEMTKHNQRTKHEPTNNNLTVNYEGIRTTLSQPMLNSHEHHQRHVNDVNKKITASGTMYRPDIFYQGSVHNLHLRQSHGELSVEADRYGSLRRERSHIENQEMHKCCGCIPCSRETKDTFQEMMDFSLLKDPIFLIFTFSNFCTSIGFNIPYIYLPPQSEMLGLSNQSSSYLLAVIGIANTVGRVILGYLSDKPWVNRLLVYNICLTIAGLATAFSVLCLDFTSLAVYASVYGVAIGAYVGLTSVILVDLLGLEKLTNAFGLLLLFQGIASFIGAPLAGWLYDTTGSYNPGFILAGVMITISGVVLFLIPPLRRYLKKREHASQNVHDHFADNNGITITA